MRKILIAIDGYAATGKSTTARQVAQLLSYMHLDSGAMYRAFTWYLLQKKLTDFSPQRVIPFLDTMELVFARSGQTLRITYQGKPLQDELRTPQVGKYVSIVSAIPQVRSYMIHWQRQLAQEKGVVMDGRDIGSVVLPDAELKVFMQAQLYARVQRRLLELQAKGFSVSPQEVEKELLERDYLDTHREINPLRKASDAHVLDTTHLTIPEQVQIVLAWAQTYIHTPYETYHRN
ncbi:MAG: (d)CMP kinase [Bacteroidia bacterium]